MIGYLTPNYALIHAFRPRTPGRGRSNTRRGPRIFQMAPKLTDLFAGTQILASKGTLDRPISGIVMDSRRAAPGSLFFALPGRRTDGSAHVDEAIGRGAVAIVSPRLPTHPHGKVTFIQVADARAALAEVSRRYFRYPDRDLELVGVTGTNGKTTVTHLLRHLLAAPGRRVGLLGTISYDLGRRTVPAFITTPESLDISGMLAQVREAGCREAVLEVSSHGIDQKRVLGLEFDAAVFTNLTRDHLDYHAGIEAYFEVKSRLFTGGTGHVPRVAAINLDDPYGRRLLELLPPGARAVGYGEHTSATVRAEQVSLNFKDTRFRLVWPEGSAEVISPLIGRYNLSNLLGAFAACYGLGRDLSGLAAKAAEFPGVAGRMERIETGQPFNVLVDYAHTDDALRNALGMLRAITPGRLLAVFGCGGDRDRSKRPLMTAAVQEIADFAWATADNPRGECLEQIFADMRAGVSDPARIAFVDDRRRAISFALEQAGPGDCVLIAGKGHETFQEFADKVIPFDDRQVARELIGMKPALP